MSDHLGELESSTSTSTSTSTGNAEQRTAEPLAAEAPAVLDNSTSSTGTGSGSDGGEQRAAESLAAESLALRAIKAVIEDHVPPGVGAAAWMEAAFAKHRSGAYRQLRSGAWKLTDLGALASALGMPIHGLFEALATKMRTFGTGATSPESPVAPANVLPANVLVEDVSVRATVFFGEPGTSSQLVAIKRGRDWELQSLARSLQRGESGMPVRAMWCDVPPCPHAALLDDDRDIVELGRELLASQGWTCTTFRSAKDLEASLPHTRYDAFVLDWRLSRGETCDAVVQSIRATPNGVSAPIFLITGAMDATDNNAGAVTDAMTTLVRTFKVAVKAKPVNWRLLSGEMFAQLSTLQGAGAR